MAVKSKEITSREEGGVKEVCKTSDTTQGQSKQEETFSKHMQAGEGPSEHEEWDNEKTIRSQVS